MYDELINKLRIGAKCFPGYELYGYSKEPFRLMPEHLTQAADAIEDLENRLNLWRQDKIRRWIPVTERLPEENGHYLVHAVGNGYCSTYIALWNGRFRANFEMPITHWMPLPQLPKENKE